MHRSTFVHFVAGIAALMAMSSVQASIAGRAVRAEVAGINVIVYPMDVEGVVTLAGSMPAGDWHALQSGGNPAVATLTAMMLDKGTTKQDKFAIASQLDGVGAELGFEAQSQTVSIAGKSLKKDVGRVIRLLAEQLRSPSFSAAEFATVKTQFEAAMRMQLDDTSARASEALFRSIFPGNHPNAPMSTQKLLQAAERATGDDVRAFHAKYYGTAHMTLVFVGDVDTKLIHSEVRKAFAGWSGGVGVTRTPLTSTPSAPSEQTLALADKASVSVLLGQATGLRFQDPDRHALMIATAILGSGFTGRLMSTVRGKEGLTYGIGASLLEDNFVDGAWAISATFAPDLLEKGIASTRRELDKWWREGVTASELEHRKSNLIGSFQVGLATTRGMASSIVSSVERGVGIEWLDRYPAVIESLDVAQVNAAIKKYLDPQKMILVKAGTLSTT